MADFLHVVLLPQAGDLLDWGGSGGQKIDTGGSVSLRRTILPKDFKPAVPRSNRRFQTTSIYLLI